jgi:hypothetical protein
LIGIRTHDWAVRTEAWDPISSDLKIAQNLL